ncbi:ectoine synthase [Micromonospora sp. WMMD998]|uniref:ectoine synthase n=1 Tax=Micromonospora sp. WMMD998 TaxID=3016092 RepID=UPI00249BAA5C|nr:ectoine synthase [Micromonospora sp. WMMD998]WFE37849.1 ectoine synthase [Micromonospora sp. WMMD998]
MIVKTRSAVPAVDWGNGTSFRLLVARDNMGFAVAHTVVTAGSKSPLQYRNHLEACYCISGRGQVISDGVTYDIEPGVIYALDQHDEHFLIADPEQDMELISVFNPPLRGDERHNLDADGFSEY